MDEIMIMNKFRKTNEKISALTNNGEITARVTLTQAEYDALVTAGTVVVTTEYIIIEEDA